MNNKIDNKKSDESKKQDIIFLIFWIEQRIRGMKTNE